MSPWVALLLFMIGNAIAGSGMLMLVKGTYPPPLHRRKSNPMVATFTLLVGLTLIMHFGVPDLFNQLLNSVTKMMG